MLKENFRSKSEVWAKSIWHFTEQKKFKIQKNYEGLWNGGSCLRPWNRNLSRFFRGWIGLDWRGLTLVWEIFPVTVFLLEQRLILFFAGYFCILQKFLLNVVTDYLIFEDHRWNINIFTKRNPWTVKILSNMTDYMNHTFLVRIYPKFQ